VRARHGEVAAVAREGAAARRAEGEAMTDDADRLIAAALRDHARVAPPPHLRARLERRYLGGRRRWVTPALAAAAGALAAALALIVLRPAPRTDGAQDVAIEAVGDHQRVLAARGLGVEASDMHQVKPWFAGKIDFVPPVTFLGDDEFPLRGGDVAIFEGHRAAAFVYGRRLHVISLFVFEGDSPASEKTIRGFHVATWESGGFGFALVSDVAWDDLHRLRARLTP
jgi:anti-sigma factor RsiW